MSLLRVSTPILSLNSLDFFCLFSIILARYMGSQDPVSLHFSPFLDLFCYFMESSGPNMIYVGKFSCTVTHNFNMFTQEISLKQLKVNKNSQSRLLICEENFEFQSLYFAYFGIFSCQLLLCQWKEKTQCTVIKESHKKSKSLSGKH